MKNLTQELNSSIHDLFTDLRRSVLMNPHHWLPALRVVNEQRKAQKKRAVWESVGTHVPPMLIVSVTNRCNLSCKGCYNQKFYTDTSAELSDDRLLRVFEEARELGIAFVLLAGGEPLTRKNLLEYTAQFPEITFLLFTNGTLIDVACAQKLSHQRHVIPVISSEGSPSITDDRRGSGIFAKAQNAFVNLRKKNLFWGTSITVTRDNFPLITSENIIESLSREGCSLYFFVEYVPVAEGSEDKCLTQRESHELRLAAASFRKKFRSLFIDFPGDEERFGGCLAAGRGFVHINAAGGVEACPFAPVSDVDIRETSLKSALSSNLMQTIRDHHHLLTETKGGCALWHERDWLRSIAKGTSSHAHA